MESYGVLVQGARHVHRAGLDEASIFVEAVRNACYEAAAQLPGDPVPWIGLLTLARVDAGFEAVGPCAAPVPWTHIAEPPEVWCEEFRGARRRCVCEACPSQQHALRYWSPCRARDIKVYDQLGEREQMARDIV